MTRTGNRRFWLLIIIGLIITAYYVLGTAQDTQVDISSAESKKNQLQRDLRAGNLFSAALADLDSFTINENNATTLDILRHLGLEESVVNYKTMSRSIRPIAGTDLFVRRFNLSGEMTFAEAMSQIDWLHNTNKVVINTVELEPGEGFGDIVSFNLEGTLYGIRK